MKKILGIAFATILLSSCSQTPSVIGTWRLDSVTMDGQEIPIDDCKKKSIVIKGDTLCLEKVFISQGKNVTVTTKLLKQ